jgi:hypothetical protein
LPELQEDDFLFIVHLFLSNYKAFFSNNV